MLDGATSIAIASLVLSFATFCGVAAMAIAEIKRYRDKEKK